MKSKYLHLFENLKEVRDQFELTGDYMLVERIPEEEKKTRSGLVLAATPSSHKDALQAEQPVFCHVLAVGEGFYNEETGEDVPNKTQPGDVILISPMAAIWFKTFGTVISEGTAMVGVTMESEIKMRFKGYDGYKRTFEALSEASESVEKEL